MTTLIVVYHSDGCQRCCDARECICGGRSNRGGPEQAGASARHLAEQRAGRARAAGQDITRAELAITTASKGAVQARQPTDTRGACR